MDGHILTVLIIIIIIIMSIWFEFTYISFTIIENVVVIIIAIFSV